MDTGPDFTGWFDRTTDERLKIIQPMFEFNQGVALGIILPFTPISSLYAGEEPDVVAGQTAGSAIATWLTLTALGGAELGSVQVARSMVTRAAVTTVAPVAPLVASVYATEQYIGFHERHQPEEPTHQPSWWNSLAAAMGGTFGGMSY